jgi:hypothetical protein
MPIISLPTNARRLEPYTLSDAPPWPQQAAGDFNRLAYAAVHVVADPLANCDPFVDAAVDWEATMDFRRHIWDLGLGVADAMDTAQRGMGMDWPSSRELIERTLEAARNYDGEAPAAFGTGTDQLIPDAGTTVDDVVRAYEEQCEAVEAAGGRIVLMASRALAACAESGEDYVRVYGRILSQTMEPVIIHWLGDMFDPALTGYWGTASRSRCLTGRERLRCAAVCPAVCECTRATTSTSPNSLPATSKATPMRCSASSMSLLPRQARL